MTEMSNTAGVRWRLRELLERHDLTAYRLTQQLKGKMNPGSVYALARGETERVSLATLGNLLAALDELTGKRYAVGDLLEYVPAEDSSSEPEALQAGQALLSPPGKHGEGRGLSSPVPVKGPTVEDLLNE